jgi:hypothetical protein
MYCISSASERKHEIACTSWLSCLWKLCELVSNIEEQLCIVFMYTGNPYHLHDLAIWKWFKNVYIWTVKCICMSFVWTTDLGFCQVSLLNTFSMARLKTLQFRLTLTSPFHCHASISYLSFTIFFSWSVIGVVRVSSAVRRQRNFELWLGYFFYSRDPRFKSLIDSPWFVKFSKMANFNFRESWFGFFYFLRFVTRTPPFIFKFSSMEKVYKIDLNLQTFFLQFSSLFYRRHPALMSPS